MFIPDNDAFAAMEPGVLDELTKPQNKLMYDGVTGSGEAETIAGVPIRLTVDGDRKTIGNAVIGSDIEASTA